MRARRGKEKAAPSDRPRAKKKVIRAPAVSPSLGSTNLEGTGGLGSELRLCVPHSGVSCYSLWRVRHGQADKVAAGHGEEDHDDGERGVVVEEDGQVSATLNIAEHEQGDEEHPGDHQHREQARLFTRLTEGAHKF